jgi:hypothetical protein
LGKVFLFGVSASTHAAVDGAKYFAGTRYGAFERGNRVAKARCHSNVRSAICLVVQTMLHKESAAAINSHRENLSALPADRVVHESLQRIKETKQRGEREHPGGQPEFGNREPSEVGYRGPPRARSRGTTA